ncbi:MAG: methyltransferase domain-containing protein, partial [Thermoplasmata archaeon]
LYLAGVEPGGTVIEAGCGTGSLTTVLAFAIGPSGHLYAFDRREDFLAGARSNLLRFGLEGRVEFQLRDVVESGFDVGPVHSVLLDLPEPWRVAETARHALVPGGRLAVFTPTYNQLERSVRALREAGFVEVQSTEVLQRALHTGEGGTRPDFEMLGHTGFLTGARKVD